jgi:hypothetical protein
MSRTGGPVHKRHRSRHIHTVVTNSSDSQRLTAQVSNEDRGQILNALGSVVYAVRLPGPVIKIGCSSHLGQRMLALGAIEILAFKPGEYADEQAIHSTLVAHRHHGREYYHPTPEVMDVVNEMREDLGLAPVSV